MLSTEENETVESEFATLGAHASLVRALTGKGYLAPTPVQAAVLGAPERDLLVSSQTGSGKTVAFGLVLARVLLGESTKLAPASHPRALVIAPTRELAIQVQRELAWLFAGTATRVDACTGGTDIRDDFRALKRGADIVVGTPGRLVDLLERKSLDLTKLSAVVLDEADEMLDLGFRDDLETILSGAPKERRTLLFSATLPKPIRTLAARYQVDAFPVDPRAGQASPHEDIRHLAHLCKNGERFAVLVNVLRLLDKERAIVFCRTRENVGGLERQLVTHGFRATAISGDRAQSERTRALDAVRKGGMNVLVATNVAARGLDLPDVRLVVHLDLPENAETLTHRSGRTGRAGKKGDNLFIVEQREQRRAERLFREANMRLSWTPAPSAEDVGAHDRAAVRERVIATTEKPASAGAITLAEELLTDRDATALVAALLDGALAALPPGEKVTPISSKPAYGKAGPAKYGAERFGAARYGAERSGAERSGAERFGAAKNGAEKPRGGNSGNAKFGDAKFGGAKFGGAESGDAEFGDANGRGARYASAKHGTTKPAREHAPMTNLPRPHIAAVTSGTDRSGEMVAFQINLGDKDRAQANWILPLVCRRGAVTRREVGAIRIERGRTVFEIAAEVARDFAANVAEPDPRAPHVMIELAGGSGGHAPRSTPRAHSSRATAAPEARSSRTAAPEARSSRTAEPEARSSRTAAPEARSSRTAAPEARSSRTAAPEARSSRTAAPEARSRSTAPEHRSRATAPTAFRARTSAHSPARSAARDGSRPPARKPRRD